MNELLIYGGPALAFGMGFVVAYRQKRNEQADDFRQIASDNWRKFVSAAKECNAYEQERDEALASVARLTSALQAKNERLARIAEKGKVSKSGAAVHLAKIAMGDA